MSDQSPDRRTPPTETPRRGFGSLWIWLALLIVLNVAIVAILPSNQAVRAPISYSPFFLQQVRDDNVASISSKGDTIQGEFTHEISVPRPGETPVKTQLFSTEVPTFADAEQLSALLQQHDVEITASPPSTGSSFLATLIVSLLPALIIVGVIVLIMRGMGGGGAARGLTSFGRSKARRVDPAAQRVTFRDVAGIEEAKEELAQIVDFLRAPDKYKRLGARIPHGVLLTGPPGTGKTLLARALAGEAGVPFFSISASEFVEMFVGVGAARVRDLFDQAKAAAPAIVFVDELDAIGRSRAAGDSLAGHDEREQTLNQLLTQLDGFDPSIGVIVLAATNRPEILDAALLRPGRFDRRIVIQAPDTAGRRAILGVHVRSVPLDDDVDLDRLAAGTTGMVGADLANVVNEAALLAARLGHSAVTMADLENALETIILGSERRIVLTAEQRRRSAYHEAGHAVVGMLTPAADPVRKVSIIPRGMALGVTLSTPDADRFSYERDYLDARLRVALGGRAAEELVFDEVSTGAESDLKEVTALARHMVGLWGMSERLGPIVVLPEDGHVLATLHGIEGSEETARVLDEEVHRIVEEAHAEVADLLHEHRRELDALAAALLEHETLDADEAHEAAGISA